MKYFAKIMIVLAVTMFTVTAVNAQKEKIGHLDSNELLSLMPERKDAEKKLQDYAKQLEAQLTTMSTEYQNKIADYQANQATMANSVKKAKEEEIGNLQRRIQQFQQEAEAELQEKEAEFFQPLIEKARKAIKEIADENSYTYIFDSGSGALLHFPEGDNVMPLVKKKLGLE